MARLKRTGPGPRAATSKYDAHHTVLAKTYGALADLRRELADSKAAVTERTATLDQFAQCADPQRAWLLLEDYFEKLSLSRKDFPGEAWWPRLVQARGRERLENTALLFLRSGRSLPTELTPYANFERFAQIEEAEKEQAFLRTLESWMLPPTPLHLDAPRATVRVLCQPVPVEGHPALHRLKLHFSLSRPRTGEKMKTLGELIELGTRSAHEQEQFSVADWAFLKWLLETQTEADPGAESLELEGMNLLLWLSRWGQGGRFEAMAGGHYQFLGQLVELVPHLEDGQGDLILTHRLRLPDGGLRRLDEARLFHGQPALALLGSHFYLLVNPPPAEMMTTWVEKPAFAVRKLSHRLLTQLRKSAATKDSPWDRVCTAHAGQPRFVFELSEETVRLRLMAVSDRDKSLWQWNGHEWLQAATEKSARPPEKPQILDDARLEPAVLWLRQLDWFTPEPGVWVGDANEGFLSALARAWADRPTAAEYLGNTAFQRLFLAPRQLRPKLLVQGSGIDWLSVSAAWEAEGMKLTPADLQRLQTATDRFVKLPDAGWVELDAAAVRGAHETLAGMGLNALSPDAQQVDLAHAVHLDDEALQRFGDTPQARELRKRIKDFSGIPAMDVPPSVQAEMRPYQKEGLSFLCHLSRLKLGGILADDMGLGKTLQTLSWLAWLGETSKGKPKPSLVICPASVLHNWRREANRFTPHLKVLVMESGAARHGLRKLIPQHDLIITNYALLRRDLAALQKFEFRALILDEAQFIKNPSAQVTQSVKQLKADQRVALTGTPLENRMLDLWSIVDFAQPAYLGTQAEFSQTYETKGEDVAWSQRVARRRLAAKLRPILLRRLKQQVAKDLPDRIEQRRDCELGDDQRKLYLAELRRSREQVLQAVQQKGLARSKMHVLAALTRLRQICCHPQLVGNDSPSGKTETLFELLEPLIAEGQKVLVFSQFVQMLKLIETECRTRQVPTYLLTGETKDRHEVVQAFQAESNAAVFLLSLRAAGTGLNLTTASYVVLYDPWWNPAVEAQAIDRSHRIGQTRTVNAYRLIAPGTVEEKIWELQQRKAQTISDVLGEEGFARNLTKADLEYLFSED